MLRRQYKKNSLPRIDINITSLLDIMTTMIFFLIMMSGFAKFSILSVFAQLPNASSQPDLKPRFNLEMEILTATKVRLKLEKVTGLNIVDKDAFITNLGKKFTGNESAGFSTLLESRTQNELAVLIQSRLIEIKTGFPHEEKIRFMISDGVTYQQLVDFVGTVREIPDNKETLLLKNLLGKSKQTRLLFPDIAISESQGDDG